MSASRFCGSAQAHQLVKEPMQGLPARQRDMRVEGFVNLRDRIKQAPGRARLKLFMGRLAPFFQDVRHLGRG